TRLWCAIRRAARCWRSRRRRWPCPGRGGHSRRHRSLSFTCQRTLPILPWRPLPFTEKGDEIMPPNPARGNRPVQWSPQAAPRRGRRGGVARAWATAAAAPQAPIPDELLEAKEKLLRELGGGPAIVSAQSVGPSDPEVAGKENINGLYIGKKYSNGKPTGKMAVVVQVKKKITSAGRIDEDARLAPGVRLGNKEILTDIQSVGEVIAQAPFPCGNSVGIPAGPTGTIGALCVMEDGTDAGKLCFVTNNHVAANCNQAPLKTRIVCPGPADPGPAEVVGELIFFVPLNLSSSPQANPGFNAVDGALVHTSFDLVD